jgi:hypothetical protein
MAWLQLLSKGAGEYPVVLRANAVGLLTTSTMIAPLLSRLRARASLPVLSAAWAEGRPLHGRGCGQGTAAQSRHKSTLNQARKAANPTILRLPNILHLASRICFGDILEAI